VARNAKGELHLGDTSKLIAFIKANEIDVLSVDPLRKTHRVRESDNGDMGVVIEVYENIAETTNCAVHLWHHNRKGNGGETTMDSIRGAIAIIDAARSAEIMETMTDDARRKFSIEPERRRFYFRSYNGKLNFAPPVDKSSWFELESIILDNKPDGNGDNMAVV